MKKPVKISLIVCSAAFVLFLLLPFFETSATKTAAKNETAKAEPQIFTSNPLTELVGRIARFFRTRKNAEEKTAGRMTADQADELFGAPQGDTLYASAQSAGGESNTGVFSGDGAAYANAYLQTEEGDWVLIRQTSPEGSTRGMHEINVKDNAYDRFITQERQARFTPVMRRPAVKEVPDSRLARVFNPIKRLFGFGSEPDASGALQTRDGDRLASARTSSSAGLDRNKEKTSRLNRTLTPDWNGLGGFSADGSAMEPGSTEAAEAFFDLINPMRAIEQSTEWLANIKYPRTDTPEQEQEKRDFKQKRKERFNQEFQELLVRHNSGQEPTNIFQNIAFFSCGDGSVEKSVCAGSKEQEENSQPSMAEIEERSSTQFLEKTGRPLFSAKITVVLNSGEFPLIEKDTEELLNEDEKLTLKFYQFQQQLNQGNGFWVSSGIDPDSELAQTVQGAGLSLTGDPYNRYDQYVTAFLEAQKREENLTEEEISELQNKLNKNKKPYILYSPEDMQQLHTDSWLSLKDSKIQKPSSGNITFPFFTHVQNAYDYHQQQEEKHPLFYGQGNIVDGNQKLEDRVSNFTDELAQYVNNIAEIKQKINRENTAEGTQHLVKPRAQQMQEQEKLDRKNFDAANDLGTYQK